MVIRTAELHDHDAVMALLTFLNPDDPAVEEKNSIAVFKEIVDSPYLTLLLAEDADALVGSCYLNITPNLSRNAKPYAVIENVITHPDHRRKGIGTQLMQEATQLAEASGCYKIMLLTGRDGDVQNFYSNTGFKSGSKTAFVVRFDT